MMNVKQKIKDMVGEVLEKKYEIKDLGFSVEYPRDDKFGDYATNAAMVLGKRLKQDSMKIGEEMVESIKQEINKSKNQQINKTIKQEDSLFEDIKVVEPGFINFYLSEKMLIAGLKNILSGDYRQELRRVLENRKYLLEHTSANPVHTIHIGHLRNNFIGMSVYRIFKSLGAKVVLDYIDNNRGMNVTRAMLGYLIFANKELINRNSGYLDKLKKLKLTSKDIEDIIKGFEWRKVLNRWAKNSGDWLGPADLKIKPDHFDLCIYSPGARAAKDYEFIQSQVQEMLVEWEGENKDVRELWQKIIDWSWQGFELTFKRLGSRIDHVWHESEIYKMGREWVEKGLKIGVFKKLEDGAVLSDLEKFGLPDLVLLKSSGASLYNTQDLGLTVLKINIYKDFDKYIWCIGKEQSLYFRQLFRNTEQLGVARIDQLMHLSYGFLRLKSGKMSSRLGTVVNADDLMDIMKKEALAIIEGSKTDRGLGEDEKNEIAEQVMLAGLKYGLLKYNRERDFDFDINESLSLVGNSGPYIQYVYARCQSILKKAEDQKNKVDEVTKDVNDEEKSLLKILSRIEEVVIDAGEQYAPHIICDYLYKLAQVFNSFYEKHKVVGCGEKERFRINLIKAVSGVLSFNLGLLGMGVVNKM